MDLHFLKKKESLFAISCRDPFLGQESMSLDYIISVVFVHIKCIIGWSLS